VAGNTGPIVNIPGDDASKVQMNDVDRELIRNVILDLSRKNGTTIHPKSVLRNALREMYPSRFPNRKAIKPFLYFARVDGVIKEQGYRKFKMVTLLETKGEGTSDSDKTLPSLTASKETVEPILSTTLQSSEIQGYSVAGNTGSIVNIPGKDASKCQKIDVDRELIRNAMLYLSRKFGTIAMMHFCFLGSI
jgi:hypothetical protein